MKILKDKLIISIFLVLLSLIYISVTRGNWTTNIEQKNSNSETKNKIKLNEFLSIESEHFGSKDLKIIGSNTYLISKKCFEIDSLSISILAIENGNKITLNNSKSKITDINNIEFDSYGNVTEASYFKNWKIEVLNSEEGDAGGFTKIEFTVTGNSVYAFLKYESGSHRVQRVPQTETQGRVHTSAATVMVLPEAEEFDVEINMNDVRIDYFCSSGPGGQSVNTTYSAVRLTHTPTGIVAQCQDQKSQHKNKDKALKVLRSRLYELELNKKLEEDSLKRNSMVSSGDRSAKIRTYNYPQGRVTDHRIGLTLYDLQNIVNGDIQKIIDELKIVQNNELLKNSEEVF